MIATKPIEVIEASQQVRNGDGAVPDAAAAGAGVVGNEGMIGRAEHTYPGAQGPSPEARPFSAALAEEDANRQVGGYRVRPARQIERIPRSPQGCEQVFEH